MMSGWGWWGPGLFFMVLCMVAMAWMMAGHGHGAGGAHGEASSGRRLGRAKAILAERLARGEMGTEEYERRLAALERTDVRERGEEVSRDR